MWHRAPKKHLSTRQPQTQGPQPAARTTPCIIPGLLPTTASGADRIRSLTDDDSIFQAFDSYPWTKDKAFLSGLSAILGEPGSPNPQGSPTDIATHARVFYYAQRIGVQIDFAQYQQWLAAHPDHQPPQVVPEEYLSAAQPGADEDVEAPSSSGAQAPALSWQQAAPKADLYVDRSAAASQSASGAGGEPNYPMAFAEMLKLLQEGKPIPGIRQIPNTVARDPVRLARDVIPIVEHICLPHEQGVKPIGSRAAPKKPWERDEVTAPPEMDLPHSLDTEFPPLDTEASEAQSETVAS
ncbi:hypothetical protein O9K51_05484 [Purpureocillium lavendulum]|uniref:Uncharacterized protein n=1 Tax=Purpureocillium lavendulum TaxID=1247861 RepID=A0AB34FSW6_9HYPO|nr:hypothetical protein O9K51_05484 [Purpureocillium lavendulum]